MIRELMVYSGGEVIGDGLIKLPVIAGLRAALPQARISWCAAKGGTVYAGVLAPVAAGLIDEVVTASPTGAGAWDWLSPRRPFGGRRWEAVIDTQANLRRSLTARRAAERVFVSASAGGRLSTAPLRGEPPAAMVDQLLRLFGAAAGADVQPRPLTLADTAARDAAEALLPAGLTYVGLAPGAGGADRRWPLQSYLELGRRQAAKGRTPVMLVEPGDAEMVAAVQAALPEALMPEVDRTDGRQHVRGPRLVIALAGRLAAAVANDAGPGHMLAVGGAPLVSLVRDRRLATKFRPAATRLTQLIATDVAGPVDRMERRTSVMSRITVDAADAALDRMLEA